MQELSQENAVLKDNSWWSHVRATMALGIPLIGAQLAQLGIHTTDVLIVGRLGAEYLATITLAGQYIFTVFIFGMGFSIAVVPLVAQAYGRGDVTSVRRSLRMGLWVAIGYWLLMQPVFFFTEETLLLLGQQPEVAALTGRYVMIAQIGLLPGLLFIALRSLVSAINRAGVVLWATILMLVANAIFAYALVLGHFGFPALGMDGAAIVAVLVQIVGFLAVVFYVQMVPETRQYEIFARFWRPDWAALWDVVRLGLPISITLLAEVTLFAACSLIIGAIGTIELAAHGIALQLASISFMIPLGLSQGATVRIGVEHGRRDYAALRRAAITAVVIAAAMSSTAGLLFLAIPLPLAAIFLDPQTVDASDVLSVSAGLIVTAGFFQLFDGQQAVFSGLLRGLKDARVPMILALTSYWGIGFVCSWVLAMPLGMGATGVWIGIGIGLVSASSMLCLRFVMLMRRERLVLLAGA